MCVSLIVVGMSFSKHPVTFDMLSGENASASSSPLEWGRVSPTLKCSLVMVSTPRPPGGPVNQCAAKL